MTIAAKDFSGFLPLVVGTIRDNSVTDFDLYIVAEGKLVLFAPAPYRWLRDELTRLLAAGHQSLFYHIRDDKKVAAWRRIQNIDVTRGAGAEAFHKKAPVERLVQINDAAAAPPRTPRPKASSKSFSSRNPFVVLASSDTKSPSSPGPASYRPPDQPLTPRRLSFAGT